MSSVLWITQVYPRFHDDVMGSFLHRLARELPVRGYSVRVLAPAADGFPTEEALDGVEIRRFTYSVPGRRNLAYTGEMHRAALRDPFGFAGFLGAFRRAIREEIRRQPAVAHVHWWVPSGWAAHGEAAKAGVPMVLSVHGTDMRLLERMPVLKPLAWRVMRSARAVLPVSPSLARAVSRGDRGRLRGRVTVLPMPADGVTFHLDEVRRTNGGPTRFAIAARLTRQKRVDLAIRAVARLRAEERPVALDIAGQGPEKEELTELAAELGAADCVRFLGVVPGDRVAKMFREATAAVLPSDREGYGLTIVEAALCGVPTVGARSGGIADLIEDGRTGLLFAPGDVEGLTGALRRLVHDPEFGRRLGEEARERALGLTPGPLADRLVGVYRAVAPPSGNRP